MSAVPRPDRTTVVALALALSGAAFTLWLGRGLTFFSDEWAFIDGRSLAAPGSWMSPHNEHWSTVPVVAYRLLVETVGLVSYVPYLGLLVGLHLVVIGLVYRLVRSSAGSSGRDLAIGAVAVLAFFGSGFENLLWGFQIGFVGATAAGLAALLVLNRRPTVRSATLLAVLLVISLASAAVGVVFFVAVALELVLRRPWRRWPPMLVVPVGLYVAWFAVWGRAGVVVHRDPLTIDSALQAPAFVVQGFGNALGSITGLGPAIGLAVAAGVAAALAVRLARGRRLPIRTFSTAMAIVMLYALIAVSRSGVTEGQVHYTRYTYIGSVLALVGLAPLLGPPITRAWDSRRRLRPYLAGCAALVLVLALMWNVRLLLGGREIFLERAAYTRALVTVALREPLPEGVEPERWLVYVPSPASLQRLIATYGSPLSDALLPGAVERPDERTFERAERQLRDPQLPGREDLD